MAIGQNALSCYPFTSVSVTYHGLVDYLWKTIALCGLVGFKVTQFVIPLVMDPYNFDLF